MVPTALEMVVNADGFDQCSSIRRVICAGEALSGAVARRYFERSDGALYNLLGATETCVDTTYWECARDDDAAMMAVGGPLENYSTYVLDSALEPAPRGVKGEFYVGGASLARGYRGMAARTATSFVPDPFADEPGARMYRTGDVAAWNTEGGLEYMGRADDQLQVRGVRVELGEVESVLADAPGVRQAAVRAVNEAAGHADSLVGYVVFEEDAEPTAAELREHLGQFLAAAVIPSQFVPLDAMPRTSSGKINRKALPEPDTRLRSAERVLPQGETEETIATIWCEHLELDEVGVHEDFFEIGGHSLLATWVRHDLSEAFDVDVDLKLLFEATTIAGLATEIALLTANDIDMDDVLSLLAEFEET
jgi:nonribosomal peptide synthetase DhbF